jgi:protein O-mannosyl-transferase
MSRKAKRQEIMPEPAASRPQVPMALAVCGLLLLAVWFVFCPTLDYGFVNFDDDVYVSDNPSLSQGLSLKGIEWAFTTHHGSQWAPITWLSYLADFEMHGLKPTGYHLTNLLLHAATTVLLFLVLWRMTDEIWPSAFVAAVFAVHPLQVESVAWVTERKGLLSGLFFVLALGAYLRYVRKPFSIWRYAAVAVFFALGLMAKPMLVTLPCVLLLLDYWPLGRMISGRFRALLVEKIPLFLIAAVSCAIAPWAQGTAVISVEKLPMASRVSNALASSAAYLGEFFWPANLAVFYPHPLGRLPTWKPAVGLFVLLAITTIVVIRWRKSPWLPVGWFWYLGMLVPVIGLVQIGLHARADRYMYLPLIGLSIALAWTAQWIVREWRYRVWLCGSVGVLAVVALTACASQQTTHWRDSEALWKRAVNCTSQNNRAHCNLAGELLRLKKFPEAIDEFEAALKIEPGDAASYCGLGEAFLRLGQGDKAVEQYETAVRLKPDYSKAHSNLGVALARQGRFDEAIARYKEALRLQPDYVDAHVNFGNALARLKRYNEAIAQYEAALAIDPNRNEARQNLKIVRFRAKQ